MSQRSLSFPCKLLAEDFPTATTAHEYSQVFPPASPFSHIFSWDIWKCLSKYFHTVRGSFFSFVGQFVWNSKGPCEIRSLSIIRWCKFILIWWIICNILPATPREKSLPNCQNIAVFWSQTFIAQTLWRIWEKKYKTCWLESNAQLIIELE